MKNTYLRQSEFLSRSSVFILLIALLTILTVCKKDEEEHSNQNPSISFQNPTGNINLTEGDSLVIKANASDPDNNLLKVYFYVNGIVAFEDLSVPWEFTWKDFEEGDYTLSLKALDTKGGSAISYDDVYVQVAPQDEFYVNIYKGLGTFNAGNIENIEIYASSPFAEISFVELFVDDVLIGTDSTYNMGYDIEWIIPSEGEFSLRARAFDKAQNIKYSEVVQIVAEPDLPITINFSVSGLGIFLPESSVYIFGGAHDNNNQIKLVKVYSNGTLIAVENNSSISYTWENLAIGIYELQAVAINDVNDSCVSAIETIKVLPGFNILGLISDIIVSDDPERSFAIDKVNGKLFVLNPKAQSIIEEVTLGQEDLVALDYSATDEKLYMISGNSGNLIVWDENNSSWAIYSYSDSNSGTDIEIDEIHRRIYLLAGPMLHVMDMDNYTVLFSLETLTGISLALNEEDRILIMNTTGSYNDHKLFKYSVESDEPLLIQESELPNNYEKSVFLSPDHSMIVIAGQCDSGNTSEICAFSADNIDNLLGTFPIGSYPTTLAFNHSGSLLLAGIGDYTDGYIRYCNTQTFTLQGEMPLPKADAYLRMAVNQDGTWITAFTSEDYWTGFNGSLVFINIENL